MSYRNQIIKEKKDKEKSERERLSGLKAPTGFRGSTSEKVSRVPKLSDTDVFSTTPPANPVIDDSDANAAIKTPIDNSGVFSTTPPADPLMDDGDTEIKTVSGVTSDEASEIDNNAGDDESTAPDTGASNEESGSPSYQEFEALRDQYIKEYYGRDEFDYDVSADEIYKMYREQTLRAADRARRDTAAQAAHLTGGYGSSYATMAASNAYNDVMNGLNEMIPELYEAARQRYDAEGEALLDKAELAGNYADELFEESNDKLIIDAYNQGTLDEILGAYGTKSGGSDSTFAIEQRLKTAKGIYDYDGGNDTGATTYDEAIRIYAGVATGSNSGVRESYLGEHADYSEEQIRNDLITWEIVNNDGETEYLTEEEIDYLVEQIGLYRNIKYLSEIEDSEGTPLVARLSEMTDNGIAGESVYDELSSWTAADGSKLTDEQIYILMAML